MTRLPTSALRNAAHAALTRQSIAHALPLLQELVQRSDLRTPLWEPEAYLIAPCFGPLVPCLIRKVNASIARAA